MAADSVRYELIIACGLIVVSLILYLFYLNRFAAFLVNLLLRFWGWKAGSASVWIEFRAIHFSLLTGRVLLRDFHCHTSDLTARAVTCQLEWRYWIRRPLEAEDLASHRSGVHRSEEADTKYLSHSLPCRVHMKFRGLEVYLYNRVGSFDHIVTEMERRAAEATPSQPGPGQSGFSIYRIFSKSSVPMESTAVPLSTYPPSSAAPPSFRKRTIIHRGIDYLRSQLPSLDPKDLLPLSLEVSKLIITCGNAATPNLLVFDAQRTEGIVGVVPSRSRYDIYKQLFDFKMHTVNAQFLPNADYHGPMTTIGQRVRDKMLASKVSKIKWPDNLTHAKFVKLWRRFSLALAVPRPREIPRDGPVRTATQRMRRVFKRHEDSSEEIDYTTFEYAVERKLLEAPTLDITYYIDNVGFVPIPIDGHVTTNQTLDTDPEWGIDIVVHGGSLKYGPWSDRQRAELQRAFFPATFQDTQATAPLRPGDRRAWPALKVFIELRETTSIAIPFREPSKNWQWDAQSRSRKPGKREPAYLTIKVADGSTVSYTMPMIAGPKGYEPVLEVHLDSLAVSSSLNDTRFIQAESCRIRAEMPSPLAWKASRQWVFGVTLRTPVLYLLRDHINMFTDLSKDWSSGPVTPLHLWVPMIYSINLTLRKYTINVYANDFNIIDAPLQEDSNVLFSFRGEMMQNSNLIASDTYCPLSTTIPFNIEIPAVHIYMSLPKWNTHWSNDDELRGHIGKIGLTQVDGSYIYHSEVTPGNVEQLDLRISVDGMMYKLFGWTIRSFMVMRDNYFGGYTHFQTLGEHLSKRRRDVPTGDPVTQKFRPGSVNPLQVTLQLEAKNSTVVLPAGLLGFDSVHLQAPSVPTLGTCLVNQVPRFDLVLRSHDAFMEMNVDMPVMKASVERNVPESIFFASSPYQLPRSMMVVDGLNVVANRIFGPQPHVHTYVCIWEIKVGDVKASMSYGDVQAAIAAGKSFVFNFADAANAPAAELLPELAPDVTFLNISVDSLFAIWDAGPAAVEVALPRGLNMQSNDLAGESYRKVTSASVPLVEMRALHRPSRDQEWLQTGHVELQMGADIYSCPRGWKESALQQLLFLVEQDLPTGRLSDVLHGAGNRGRAVVQDSLYLPRIQLPRTHEPRQRSKRKPTSGAPQSRLRPTAAAVGSDGSDAEPNMSDLQRDALIAGLKPQGRPRGISSAGVSDGSSEADESDDTDFVTVDDHVYPGENRATDAMTRTADLCDHFSSADVRSPLSWTGSPLQCSQTVKIWGTTQSAFPTSASDTPPHALSRIAAADATKEDSSTIRLRARSVRAVVVPAAIVHAVTCLLSEVQNYDANPEFRIDAALLRHTAALSKNDIPSVVAMDVQVTDVVARSLQCLSLPELEPAKTPDIPSSVELVLHHLHLASQQRSKHMNAFVMIGHLTATTSDLSIAQSDPLTSLFHATTSSRLAFANVHLDKSGDTIRLNLGHALTDVTHRAPSSLMRIMTSVSHTAEAAAPTLARVRTGTQSDLRSVAAIFRYASQKRLVDHLATTQPAYFVQQGRPHQLRTDAPFKMLLYIRNCLSDMQDRSVLDQYLASKNSPDDRTVVSCLARLLDMSGSDSHEDQDAYRTLEQIFPQFVSAVRPARTRGSQVHVNMSSLTFNILDPDGDAPSFVTVGPVHVHFSSEPDLSVVSIQTKSSKLPAEVLDLSAATVDRIRVVVGVGRISVSVRPHMIDFVRKAASAQGRRGSAATVPDRDHGLRSDDVESPPSVPLMLEIVLRVQDLSVKAAADTLTVETGLQGLVALISLTKVSAHLPQGSQLSASTSIVVDQVFLRALSTVEQASHSDRGVLASLSFAGTKGDLLYRDQGSKVSPILRAIIGLDGVLLSVPRSAVRLYQFVNEWIEKYLPKLQAATHELVSEMHRPVAQVAKQPDRNTLVQVQLHISHILFTLQVMRGTWLSWQIDRSLFFTRSSPSSHGPTETRHYGVKLASQAIGVSSAPDLSNASVKARVRLNIPTILVTGRQDGTTVTVHASMDQLHVTVKPSHLDTVLTVQQKFGQDFSDLMALIQRTRQERASSGIPSPPVTTAPEKRVSSIKYHVYAKMRGLRIGLRGARSTLLFECEDIKGGLDDEVGAKWQLRLSDVALSVAPRENGKISRQSFTRTQRSAFVAIDLNATGEDRPEPSPGKVLRVELSKVHAVLQPSSIAEIADFINDLQTELRVRKEQRAAEMAEFKAKTLSIMRTFDVHGAEIPHYPGPSLLSRYTITFFVKNIGAAFPLVLEPEVPAITGSSRAPASSRAFLFSVKSIGFGSHFGESGQATMNDFSFQFVSSFRPNVFSDYDGLNHSTHNRVLYPEMTAQLRTEPTGTSSRLNVIADVSGFVLDLDSSLPDYVFSAMDVYRHGKIQLERINPSTLSSSAPEVPDQQSTPMELPVANICASITFRSGQIRLHSASDIPSPRGRTTSFTRNDFSLSGFGTDIIKLPEVSVWAEYHGASSVIQAAVNGENPCAELMFKSTIHSSQNTLFPGSILPFLSEFNSRLETRMHQPSSVSEQHIHVHDSASPSTQPSGPPANLRISVGLQIDRSKLELTCQPDVNVSAAVHWRSGGFFLTVEPATRHIAFSGSVQGLGVSLRHGFLSEACASVEARNLIFSASFIKEDQAGVSRPITSMIVDTELVGSLRFSRLQDLLCFKAVWLDRIPTFNPTSSEQPLPPQPKTKEHPATQLSPFLTAVCVRVRKFNVDVDLGQSISTVTLELRQFVIQTWLTHLVSELEVHVGHTHLDASGNVSGRADVPDFMFKTTRVSEDATSLLPGDQMLRLELTSGPLTLEMESEHQELLRYRAEPVEVKIFDDWSQTRTQNGSSDSLLRLSFVVHGSTITAAITASSIPRLAVYADKFNANLALQREGAGRESKAFRIAQAPKPDNALSAVAEAMLQTARTRFSEAETAISYAIAQGMDLRLERIHLALFPRRMDDTEMAQFIGRGVEAHLQRTVRPQGDSAWRDLRLAFASMAVSRLSGLNHALAKREPVADTYDWLAKLAKGASEANIFGLPAMTMAMTSEERLDGPRALDYEFESTFRAGESAIKAEDIYISLNISLYSWLTLLRKNFAREMDEVQAARSVPASTLLGRVGRSPASSLPLSPRSDSLFMRSPAPFDSTTPTPPRVEDTVRASTMPHGAFASASPALKSPLDSPVPVSLAPSYNSAVTSGNDSPSNGEDGDGKATVHRGIRYRARHRSIERLTMRQLGDATPDVMHPFFMKKAGFSLEDALPQYVHEYGTQPLEEIMKALLELYSKQLKVGRGG